MPSNKWNESEQDLKDTLKSLDGTKVAEGAGKHRGGVLQIIIVCAVRGKTIIITIFKFASYFSGQLMYWRMREKSGGPEETYPVKKNK